MNDVVICEPLRTPVGGYLGHLAGLSASDLATVVVREIARRAHLGEGDVDDVVLGNCNPSGEFPTLGGVVALDAGLGVVQRVITNLGVLDVAGDHFQLLELAPGVTADQLVTATDAPVTVDPVRS